MKTFHSQRQNFAGDTQATKAKLSPPQNDVNDFVVYPFAYVFPQ